MTSGTRIGLYALATLLICLTPGPNVLLVISLGLRDGVAAALRAVGGVALASLVYLAVAALGVVAALVASSTLFAVVRYAGAAYLVYLGLRLVAEGLRTRDGRRASGGGAGSGGNAGAGGGAMADRAQASRPGWQGFLTHLSNPKAVLFWTALLPQFLDPAAPVTRQIVLLGLLGMLIDAAVLSAYAASAAAARHSLLTRTVRHWIDLAAGVFFTVAGILLALAHRGA
ncbi:MAG: LysE family translocator [Steroidobacteraceae bacterium]